MANPQRILLNYDAIALGRGLEGVEGKTVLCIMWYTVAVKMYEVYSAVNIPMMITADYATVDPMTGKLHILGIFRNINAVAFPCHHKRMCLALIIEGDEIADRNNSHELSVALADEDGSEIFSMQAEFEMPKGQGGLPPHCNILFEFNDLQFGKRGEYCFHVRVNGKAVGSAAIQVVQLEPGNE